MTEKRDPIIDAVRADLHERSQLGIKKYGTTLTENTSDLRGRLPHAYEEALDLANYLKWVDTLLSKQTAWEQRSSLPNKEMGDAMVEAALQFILKHSDPQMGVGSAPHRAWIGGILFAAFSVAVTTETALQEGNDG